MTATLFLGQNVNLSGELGVRVNSTGLNQTLSSLDLGSLNTTKQSTNVITSLALVQQLVEHLNTGTYNCTLLFLQTNDLNGIGYMDNTTLYTAGSNGTTTGDGEYVLDRHQERLVNITLGIGNISLDLIEQLKDLVAPLAVGILQCHQSGTLNDRGVISGELVLVQQLTDLHVYQLKQLLVINHITLVHEYYNVGNAYLTSKQDVLTGLSHNTIGSSYNKDSTIHLCSTGDHVLNVVSMSGAVYVCVVTGRGLVLYVRGGDCDTTCTLLGSLVDLVECNLLAQTISLVQSVGDSSGQSGLTMVYVANGTNVTMGLTSFELSFSHF